MKAIRVTVKDLATGEEETQEVDLNDYMLIVTGDRYLAHTSSYGNGTHVLTVKHDPEGRK